jgi:hypothetical protein
VEDNIKMLLREEFMNVWNGFNWLRIWFSGRFVNMVMKFRVKIRQGIF